MNAHKDSLRPALCLARSHRALTDDELLDAYGGASRSMESFSDQKSALDPLPLDRFGNFAGPPAANEASGGGGYHFAGVTGSLNVSTPFGSYGAGVVTDGTWRGTHFYTSTATGRETAARGVRFGGNVDAVFAKEGKTAADVVTNTDFDAGVSILHGSSGKDGFTAGVQTPGFSMGTSTTSLLDAVPLPREHDDAAGSKANDGPALDSTANEISGPEVGQPTRDGGNGGNAADADLGPRADGAGEGGDGGATLAAASFSGDESTATGDGDASSGSTAESEGPTAESESTEGDATWV